MLINSLFHDSILFCSNLFYSMNLSFGGDCGSQWSTPSRKAALGSVRHIRGSFRGVTQACEDGDDGQKYTPIG